MELFPSIVPEACTLPTAEHPTRIAEWDTLFTELTSVEVLKPTLGRLSFAAGSRVEARARDLARRESECCSFFQFSFARCDEIIELNVSVPATRGDVLSSFVNRAEDVRTGRREVA